MMNAEECVAAIRALGYEAEVDEAGLPTFLLTEKQYKKGWRCYERMIRSLGWNRSWGMREVKNC